MAGEVVGYNGTEGSKRALDAAIGLAKALDAHLVVLFRCSGRRGGLGVDAGGLGLLHRPRRWRAPPRSAAPTWS